MLTTKLQLPLLAAGQSQKHVTLNEALVSLDTLTQLVAISRTETAPPASPAEGATYIVADNPTAGFANRAGQIAVLDAGAWRFYSPSDGWRCFVRAEQALLVRSGTAWVSISASSGPTTILGVNTTADAVNRFALKSEASLFDNVGAGHQMKLNKASPTQTGSLLMQTAYSGRAEIGLIGDDRLRMKVSSNGTAWKDALLVDAATGLATAFGAPTVANGIATKGYVDGQISTYANPFDYLLASNQSITTLSVWTPVANFTTIRIASPNFDTAQGRFIAPVSGIYVFFSQVIFTAGTTAATVTVAATRNTTPSGNWVSQSIAANVQSGISFTTLLSLAAGDAVGLSMYCQSPVTVNFGFTSFFGYRL